MTNDERPVRHLPPTPTRNADSRIPTMTTTAIAMPSQDQVGEGSRTATKMDRSWEPTEGGIATYHTFVPPAMPTAPSFQLHLTRLKDTLFIWAGASEGGEDEESGSVGEKRLAGDWAVAMPTRGVGPPHYLYSLP